MIFGLLEVIIRPCYLVFIGSLGDHVVYINMGDHVVYVNMGIMLCMLIWGSCCVC